VRFAIDDGSFGLVGSIERGGAVGRGGAWRRGRCHAFHGAVRRATIDACSTSVSIAVRARAVAHVTARDGQQRYGHAAAPEVARGSTWRTHWHRAGEAIEKRRGEQA
jgi:hypothetical protein